MRFETHAVTTAREGDAIVGTACYRVQEGCVTYVILGPGGGRSGEVLLAPDMDEAMRQVERGMLARLRGLREEAR